MTTRAGQVFCRGVNPDHTVACFRQGFRQYAGPTGDIEHARTRGYAREVDEYRSEEFAPATHERLIGVGIIPGVLGVRFGHDFSPLAET
jgi:hypothetical protein